MFSERYGATRVLALFAFVILTPLLYLPGYLLAAALLGPTQAPDPLERQFERVVAGTLLNGWLAFTQAELGIFSIWLHLALLALICGVVLLIARRRGVAVWPLHPLGIVAGTQPAAANQRQHAAWRTRAWAHWDVWALAAIGVLFALLVTPPFETVLGGRDAGVYANTGFAIARNGGIVQYDPLVAQIGRDQESADPALRAAADQAETNFLGVQAPTRFIASRLRAAGFLIYGGDLAAGRVVPQGLHLFPTWIGLLASVLGREGGLLATGLMGLLGVWSVGMLGRRLAGRAVGVLAALLLAANGVQVWFSRYSTSETTMQFLCFAGLYAFAVFAGEDSAPPAGNARRVIDRRTWAGALAGVALGQLALARIDFILVVGPVLAYGAYVWLTGRWARQHTVLFGALAALLLHAAIHIATIARAYFFDTLYARLQDYALSELISLPFLTPELRRVYVMRPCSPIARLWLPDLPTTPACPPFKDMPPTAFLGWNYGRIGAELAVLLILIIGVLLLRPMLRRGLLALERPVLRWARWLVPAVALLIVAAGAYGYLVRPQILSASVLRALSTCLSATQIRQPTGACLALQGYIGAPIALPPGREVFTIPLASMVRVGWYLSPLGVALAVLGFAWWWWRGLRPASWLFLVVGLVCSVFFLRQTYGTSDQSYIYILRRYVPQVYPVFALGTAYVLVHIGRVASTRTAMVRRASFALAAVLALALVGFSALTNRTIYRHVEYGGALDQLAGIAEGFSPNDVLLFRGGAPTYSSARDLPDNVTTPLTYGFGLNAITIKSLAPGKYADSLAAYIRRWQAQGRTVYLVLGPSGAVGVPGMRQQYVADVGLRDMREFEQLTNQKPTNIQVNRSPFAVYRLEPAAAAPAPQAWGPNDFGVQVRGFYQPETIAGVTLAWTNGVSATVRLPWPAQDAPTSYTVQLAGGKRPASIGPAQVCMAFAPETTWWYENGPPQPYGSPQCVTLQPDMRGYMITFDPRGTATPPTGSLLLQISSPAWVPAKEDPAQRDQRSLGVQFGGVAVAK